MARATASSDSASSNARVEVGVVPWTTTRAPRLARWLAITRPIPREEPVTHATLLFKKVIAHTIVCFAANGRATH